MSANETINTSATGGQKAGNLERYDLIPAHPLQQLARYYSASYEGSFIAEPSFADLNWHLWQFWSGEDFDDNGTPHMTAVALQAFEMLVEELKCPGEHPEVGDNEGRLERYDHIPAEPLRRLAEHFGRGALKYADDNWRRGYDWKLSFAALNRHLWQWWAGQANDPETGSHHLTAVAWHAMVLTEFQRIHPQFDTRNQNAVLIAAESEFETNTVAQRLEVATVLHVDGTLNGQHYLAQQRLLRNPETQALLERAEADFATDPGVAVPVHLDVAPLRLPRVRSSLHYAEHDAEWVNPRGHRYRWVEDEQRWWRNTPGLPNGFPSVCIDATYGPFTEVVPSAQTSTTGH